MLALPTLACIDTSTILLLWLIIFGIPILLLYVPYRWAINRASTGWLRGKPLALFQACISAGLGVLMGMLAFIYVEPGFLPASSRLLFGILALGFTVVISLMVAFKLAQREQQLERKLPLQVWMQDLFVAMFSYAGGVSFLAWYGNFDPANAADYIPSAIYLLLAGTLGLLIAADVARRSTLGQQALPRALLFAMVFTLFPLILPFALVGWWRWRRSSRTAERAGEPRIQN